MDFQAKNILENAALKDISAKCVKVFSGKIFLVPKMATDFLNEEVAASLLQREDDFFFFNEEEDAD